MDQLEGARFGPMRFWVIYSSVLRVPLGCLEVLEMILEGTWTQHYKTLSRIEREALFAIFFLIRIRNKR